MVQVKLEDFNYQTVSLGFILQEVMITKIKDLKIKIIIAEMNTKNIKDYAL